MSNLESIIRCGVMLLLVTAVALQHSVESAVLTSTRHRADRSSGDDVQWSPLATAIARGDPALLQATLQDDPAAREQPCGPGGIRPLMLAAALGRVDVMAALVDGGAEIDAIDQFGRTAVMHALAWGRSASVAALAECGADVSRRTAAGSLATHVAVAGGDLDSIAVLGTHGVDWNARDGDGLAPLHRAARSGHADVVEALLELGASPRAITGERRSPLHSAAARRDGDDLRTEIPFTLPPEVLSDDSLQRRSVQGSDHAAIVRMLALSGARLDALDRSGRTALSVAALHDDLELAQSLVELGADLERSGPGGVTALHRAAAADHVDLVQFLLERGADPTRAAADGRRAIHVAASGGGIRTVDLLLAAGESIDALDQSGSTPLLHAAAARDADTVAALADRGGSVSDRSRLGVSAIMAPFIELVLARLTDPTGASPGSDVEAEVRRTVAILLERGAVVGAVDASSKRNALHLCAIAGLPSVIPMLVNAGEALDGVDRDGLTPLHYATSFGNRESVAALLEAGAALESVSPEGFTPLSIAVRRRLTPTVLVLLEHGADPNAADVAGVSPTVYATRSGPPAALRALARLGGSVEGTRVRGVELDPLLPAGWGSSGLRASYLLGAAERSMNSDPQSARTMLMTARLELTRALGLNHPLHLAAIDSSIELARREGRVEDLEALRSARRRAHDFDPSSLDGVAHTRTPSDIARDALSADPDVRREGILALSEQPFGGEPPYRALYRSELDRSPHDLLIAAITALGRHGIDEDRRVLEPLCRDSRETVRVAAQAAITSIEARAAGGVAEAPGDVGSTESTTGEARDIADDSDRHR